MSFSMKGQFGRAVKFPPSTRGFVHPDRDGPAVRALLKDIDALLRQGGGRIIHEGRNRLTVVRLPLDSFHPQEVVIKQFRPRGLKRIKTLILPSSASKAWRGAASLQEKGLNTPFPLACLEERKGGIATRSFILTEYLAESEEIRSAFREWDMPALKPLISRLAEFLRRCHRAGIYHRDLSDGNILVKTGEGGGFEPFMIDTNRIRLSRRIGGLRGVKGLVRLGVPDGLQEYFLKEYCRPQPLRPIQWRWYRFNKKKYSGFVEIKKKLRLRSIAERLRLQ